MNVCPICKRAPRVGEGHRRIRLTAEDMHEKKYPVPKTPGLYQCCEECHAEYLPVVAHRLGKKVEEMAFNEEI